MKNAEETLHARDRVELARRGESQWNDSGERPPRRPGLKAWPSLSLPAVAGVRCSGISPKRTFFDSNLLPPLSLTITALAKAVQ